MSASEQTLTFLRALPVRSVALVVGAIAAAIWVGGLISGSGWTLSFDADLGLPNVYSGWLVIVAGGLLWLAGGSPSASRPERRAWRSLAVVLALIGAEQALSLHERMADRLEPAAVVGALPLLIPAAVALLLALRLPTVPERRLLLAGLVLWTATGALDALGRGDAGITALLALTAAPVLAVGALTAVQRARSDPAAPPRFPAELALRDLLLRVDPARLATALLIAFAVLFAAAAVYHTDTAAIDTFDLRSTQGANTFTSITLLVVAGGLALLRARLSDDPWFSWTLLGIALLGLAANDTISGHHLIGRETGIPGQFGLLPLVAMAGLGWLGCVSVSAGRARQLLIGGAVAWVLSQVMDVVEALVRDRPEGEFHWWIFPEEALELAGSTLFILALILAVQATARAASSDSEIGEGRGGEPSSSPAAAGGV